MEYVTPPTTSPSITCATVTSSFLFTPGENRGHSLEHPAVRVDSDCRLVRRTPQAPNTVLNMVFTWHLCQSVRECTVSICP